MIGTNTSIQLQQILMPASCYPFGVSHKRFLHLDGTEMLSKTYGPCDPWCGKAVVNTLTRTASAIFLAIRACQISKMEKQQLTSLNLHHLFCKMALHTTKFSTQKKVTSHKNTVLALHDTLPVRYNL